MFILQAILVLEMILSVNCLCNSRIWNDTVHPNQPSCQRGNFYVRGLIMSFRFYGRNLVTYFDGAQCCGPPPAWNSTETLVKYVEWHRAVDEERLYVCPNGFFLNGFYTVNDAEFVFQRLRPEDKEIARVRCVKPAAYPVYYDDCYEHKRLNFLANFARKNYISCKEGYYMTGLKKNKGGSTIRLHFVAIICCSMAYKPHEIRDFEDLKTRVMDTTLMKMAELADMLGFEICKGSNGMYCGEDISYNPDGNFWETNNKTFDKYEKVENKLNDCGKVLQIVYDDWSLAVKNITYDKIVDDLLQPETLHSGAIYNWANVEVKEFFEISQTLQEIITHSVKKTIDSASQRTVALNFELSGLGVESTPYSAVFDLSNTTSQNEDTLNSRTYKRHHEIILRPYTAAKYNVSVGRSKTAIQYTAFVTATFSAQLKGYLKSHVAFSGQSINYHNRYQGRQHCLSYRFGNRNVSFYKALKKQRESNSGPWLWNEIEKSMPGVREVINRLTDERLYEFKIQGTLEKVSGTKIDVVWETLKLDRNSKKGKVSNKKIKKT